MRKKGLVIGLVGVLLLFSGGALWSQEEESGGQPGMGMMGGGMMGRGMMGGGMMRMMGPVMQNPEIMGTLMMMHGETLAAVGEISRRYEKMGGGGAPEMRDKMNRELMIRIGEILTKYGQILKEKGEKLPQ